MYYRCIKVQHKPINIQVRDPIQRTKRNQVCYGLAHRTVSGAPEPYRVQAATLGFSQACSTIIHRPVRCATGRSGVPAGNGYLCATVDCKSTNKVNSASAEVRAAKSEGIRQSGVAPNCPVPQGDKAPTVDFAPNPNGWVTWQCIGQPTVPVRWCTRLSSAPIACSLPNGYFGG
jgi:hypothetical protein